MQSLQFGQLHGEQAGADGVHRASDSEPNPEPNPEPDSEPNSEPDSRGRSSRLCHDGMDAHEFVHGKLWWWHRGLDTDGGNTGSAQWQAVPSDN